MPVAAAVRELSEDAEQLIFPLGDLGEEASDSAAEAALSSNASNIFTALASSCEHQIRAECQTERADGRTMQLVLSGHGTREAAAADARGLLQNSFFDPSLCHRDHVGGHALHAEGQPRASADGGDTLEHDQPITDLVTVLL